MNIKSIQNDDDLYAAFQRLEAVYQAACGTPAAAEMDKLVTLIEAYESRHYPISPVEPAERTPVFCERAAA